MQDIPTSTLIMLIMLIAFALAIAALIGWLIYRNMKDEKQFEQEMDNPKRNFERDKGEKT